MERAFAFDFLRLPDALAIGYVFVVGLGPPIIAIGALFALAYLKWFIPSRTRIVNEQLLNLSTARKAMAEAAAHIETFEQELERAAAEAQVLRAEIDSLRTLNSESKTELENKIRAFQSLSRGRVWVERLFAFILGVVSSIAANYIWLVLQPKP